MGALVALLFLFIPASSVAAPCIDFWGAGCSIYPTPKKQVKKQQKKETKEELLKKLYEESLNWTPSNLSPLEKYVAVHPEDREAVALLRRYLAERQIRACYLERGLLGEDTSYCKQMEKAWSRWLGEKNFTFTKTPTKTNNVKASKQITYLFFYSSTCPHCQKTLPVVKKVLGDRVKLIQASEKTASLFLKWKVFSVPALVAVRGKKALRLSGEFTEEQLKKFLAATTKLLPNQEDSSVSVATSQNER